MGHFEVMTMSDPKLGDGWVCVVRVYVDEDGHEMVPIVATFSEEYAEMAEEMARSLNGSREQPSSIVYRILDDGGQACTSAGHPDRYHQATFTSKKRADQAVRNLNEPDQLPQPPGSPYRRQDGEIHWKEIS